MNKKLIFSLKDPIHKEDSEECTYGCRHSNPDICKSAYMDGVCAFCAEDKKCKNPPNSWRKFYKEKSNDR